MPGTPLLCFAPPSSCLALDDDSLRPPFLAPLQRRLQVKAQLDAWREGGGATCHMHACALVFLFARRCTLTPAAAQPPSHLPVHSFILSCPLPLPLQRGRRNVLCRKRGLAV